MYAPAEILDLYSHVPDRFDEAKARQAITEIRDTLNPEGRRLADRIGAIYYAFWGHDARIEALVEELVPETERYLSTGHVQSLNREDVSS